MITVPEIFKEKHPFPYPKTNKQVFEEWYYEHFTSANDKVSDRQYLPVFWTGYHVAYRFGQIKKMVEILQYYVDSLPRDKKYYTVCQYDDGPLVDFKDLDIKVFAMSGPRVDYALPLIYQLQVKPNFGYNKSWFCNFVGRDTHFVRRQMINYFQRTQTEERKYYISTHDHSPSEYLQVLARSTFTLAPRGYGQTSFRLMEAVSMGSIPVYISDKFLFPHNAVFSDYGVAIHSNQIDNIDKILSSFSEDLILKMRSNLPTVYETVFTYEANKKYILDNIKD